MLFPDPGPPAVVVPAPPALTLPLPPSDHHISMDEFFASQVPIGVNPAARVPLNITLLRQLCREYLVSSGYQTA